MKRLKTNQWHVKDRYGDDILISVGSKGVLVTYTATEEGDQERNMGFNLEKLDYLIASLQEARELFKNVRRKD